MQSAVGLLKVMGIGSESFVGMHAILLTGSGKWGMSMTQEQFEREKNYRVSVAIAKTMLSNRLISEHEYSKIERMLRVKYKPVFGGL